MRNAPFQSGKLSSVRPRSVRLTEADIVKYAVLRKAGTAILVCETVDPHAGALAWALANQSRIEAALQDQGGILLRGFRMPDAAAFGSFVQAVAGDLIPYTERSSPRKGVWGNVYTSTEHPADQRIFLHNENSYASIWPLRIVFFCQTAAAEGGSTPVCDVRAVYQAIPPAIRDRFTRSGVEYVRNFTPELGMSWQYAFQCDDPQEVEAVCRRSGYDVEWLSGGRLRTRRVGQAAARHPVTGQAVWFNHAAFFHVSTLDPGIRTALLAQVPEAHLPNQTYYGDGSPIEPEVLDTLREAYFANTLTFAWQPGDILCLDNMLLAHGREPYRGERKVLVGMARPCSGSESAFPR